MSEAAFSMTKEHFCELLSLGREGLEEVLDRNKKQQEDAKTQALKYPDRYINPARDLFELQIKYRAIERQLRCYQFMEKAVMPIGGPYVHVNLSDVHVIVSGGLGRIKDIRSV